MEENIYSELKLDEEELQEITGGCATCTAQLSKAADHANFSEAYEKIAARAEAKGKDPTSYNNLAKGHLDASKKLLAEVVWRGH